MSLHNTSSAYGSIAKSFHWGMAAIFIGLFIGAYIMMDMPSSEPKFFIYGIHKSFGVLALILAAARLIWKFFSISPAPATRTPLWQILMAKMAHFGLYILMFAMPMSGYVMSTAGGHPVKLFGLELPALISQNPELAKMARNGHTWISYAILALVSAHIIGALYHHWIRKDDTLKSMAGNFRKSSPK
jgi:cytochrome b561